MSRCNLWQIITMALLPAMAASPALSQTLDAAPAAATEVVTAAPDTPDTPETPETPDTNPPEAATAARDTPAESAPGRQAQRQPTLEEQVGIFQARRRLGRDVPTGRDVVVGHVEGTGNEYLPDWKDVRYRGTLFVQRSGPGETFGHAQSTAKVIYGRGGLAPGVSVVHCFSTAHWLENGYLHVNGAELPEDDLPRVFNHSWIASPPQGAELVLRRVDYQIDERDVLMCVGVNNGRDSAVPPMLASAYNVIAVGAADGDSSGGFTTVEVAGRSKPDIVAPAGTTSAATPIVTACVARLVEAAESTDEQHRDRATRSELIKAVLLAGARKPDGWQAAPGKPLDEHLGAGVVHVDQSLVILENGPIEPGDIRRRYGWDLRPLNRNQRTRYRFTTTQPLGEVSIILNWNRRIGGTTVENPHTNRPIWVGLPRLADFDLRLVRLDSERGDSVETIAASTSSIDNVEHLYLPSLEPGEYIIEVQRQADGHDEPWDYALAWRVEAAQP